MPPPSVNNTFVEVLRQPSTNNNPHLHTNVWQNDSDDEVQDSSDMPPLIEDWDSDMTAEGADLSNSNDDTNDEILKANAN